MLAICQSQARKITQVKEQSLTDWTDGKTVHLSFGSKPSQQSLRVIFTCANIVLVVVSISNLITLQSRLRLPQTRYSSPTMYAETAAIAGHNRFAAHDDSRQRTVYTMTVLVSIFITHAVDAQRSLSTYTLAPVWSWVIMSVIPEKDPSAGTQL